MLHVGEAVEKHYSFMIIILLKKVLTYAARDYLIDDFLEVFLL